MTETRLQWSGYRRCNDISTGAGHAGGYLDHRDIRRRQGRNWQFAVSNETSHDQRQHQKACRNRPENEWRGYVHRRDAMSREQALREPSAWTFEAAADPARVTDEPCCNLNCPSTTITSLSVRPLSTTAAPPCVIEIVIGLTSARPATMTKTKVPCGPRCTAWSGTTKAFCRVDKSSLAFTNCPGHNF